MTNMTVFNLYLILILVHLCTIVVTTKLVIDPEEAYKETGTDLNITCTCSSGCLAKDIQWLRNSTVISENISAVNETTSQISLYNLQFNDTAQFQCCVKPGVKDTSVCSIPLLVRVGIPPGPVQNFICISRNIIDFWCEWDEGDPTNFRMTYVFQYKPHYQANDPWIACPDSKTKGENSCYIPNATSLQHVRVNSSNVLGSHTDSTSFNLDTQSIPNPPCDVTLNDVTHNTLQVSWKIPAEWNNGIFPILIYKIQYKSTSHNEWFEKITDVDTTNTMLTELTPFTSYEVQVAAKIDYTEEEFWSDWSEKFSIITNESVPVGVVVSPGISDEYPTEPSKRDVILLWKEMPVDQRNGIIRGYLLYVRNDNDYSTSKHDTPTTTVTLNNLERYAKYTVVIQAYNSAGSGPNTTFCCIQDITEAPSSPTEILGDPISNSSIRLTWEPPNEPNGIMQHYDVQWRVNSIDDNWPYNGTTSADSDQLKYELKGLQVYTSYDIKIRAINHKYTGQWEELDNPIRTKEGAPAKAPEPISLEEDVESWEKLKVSWTPLKDVYKNGIIRGYHISYCLSHQQPECEGGVSNKNEIGDSASFAVIDNLEAYTTYLVWVTAYTDAGQGPFSAKQLGRTGQGIPSAPQNFAITDITSSNVSLEWDAPSEPKGVISHYQINYYKEPLFDVINGSLPEVRTLHAVVVGLWGNVQYLFKVIGCNGAHCGKDVGQAYGKTKIGAPGSPFLHTNIAPKSSELMFLSWDPPVPPNGPIDSYYVENRPSTSTGTWMKMKVSPSRTSANVTVDCGVGDDGIMFDFRVYAATKLQITWFYGDCLLKSVSLKCVVLFQFLFSLLQL
ncbi:protein sidekick-1-like isoform X2 [Amphiura filiformis]|uniref:protein sidekick-1-like isoform X2 n=1 Tax=Amphiura filiformis TaxID=82378 RepID=UPI003B2236B2